jgi:hypothetical protein
VSASEAWMPLLTAEEFAEREGVTLDEVRLALNAKRITKAVRLPGRWEEWRIHNDAAWIPPPDVETFDAEMVAAVLELVEAIGKQRALAYIRRRQRLHLAPSVRDAVMARDGRRCRYCHKSIGPRTNFHLDHVVPVYNGGTNDVNNLVVACTKCNASKGTQTAVGCECGRLTWEPPYSSVLACGCPTHRVLYGDVAAIVAGGGGG